MSLILEALRKSEAERRRGEVPSVYNELPATRRSSKIRFTRLLRLGARGVRRVGDALGRSCTADTRVRHATGRPRETRETRGGVASSAPARCCAPDAAPRRAAHRQRQNNHGFRRRHLSTNRRQRTTATTTPAIAEPELPTRVRHHAPTTHDYAPAVAPANDDMLRLSDLDPDSRKAVAATELSMHMWNSDPSQRFVILDGNRRARGRSSR
jgi:general secretion pathway protein B